MPNSFGFALDKYLFAEDELDNTRVNGRQTAVSVQISFVFCALLTFNKHILW